MSVRIMTGDAREILRSLPDGCVNCCVTSPPYFGLRSYLPEGHPDKRLEIGLEPTPDAYVAEMVAVFREVRRVLRDDGTVWLNLGDSYAGSWGAQGRGGPPSDKSTLQGNGHIGGGPKVNALSKVQVDAAPKRTAQTGTIRQAGLKPKDLIGIPWSVAFALRADGWYLRQDIIWHKPNPMPESVTDRPTSSYEHVFLLAKNERYWYDAEAIAEPSCVGDERPQTRRARELAVEAGLTDAHLAALKACGVADAGKAQTTQSGYGRNRPEIQALADEAKAALGGYTREFLIGGSRNARNVWTIATQPYSGAHFATMPPALVERCIKAGCPRGGTILDPFGGAGTTGLVANRLQRSAILIEINPAYLDIARARLRDDAGMFSEVIG